MPATPSVGSHAIIVGAGIGGLGAAAAVAPFFDRVSILDKDKLPAKPDVRPGVGQSGHSHLLLKAGEQFAEALLPGIRDDFLKAGAVEINVNKNWHFYDSNAWLPTLDCGFSVLAMSRPGYEQAIRSRIQKLPNVSFYPETTVRKYLIAEGRCTGVDVGGNDARFAAADLVIDSSALAGLLTDLMRQSFSPVRTDSIGVNITYTTATFQRPREFADVDEIIYCQPFPPDVRWGMLIPIEGRRWSVSLGGRGGTYPPRELPGFLDYAKQIATPYLYHHIKDATLVGTLRTFRKMRSHWHHFEEVADMPGGVLPVGDAVASYNPTFGQGMTVALGHAHILRGVLEARNAAGLSLADIHKDYLPQAAALAGWAWNQAAFADMAFAETEATRPPDYERSAMAVRTLRKLIESDMEILKLRMQVANMLTSPQVFREGPMLQRIMAAMQAPQAAASG